MNKADNHDRDVEIRRLCREGKPQRQIAKDFGPHPARINQIVWFKKSGRDRPITKGLPISAGANTALVAEAKRRGMTPIGLAALIISAVATDGLWLAVLDDEDAEVAA